MLEIKVLCPCCANCRKPEEFVRDALSTTGVKAEVLKITDMREIIAHSLPSPSSW